MNCCVALVAIVRYCVAINSLTVGVSNRHIYPCYDAAILRNKICYLLFKEVMVCDILISDSSCNCNIVDLKQLWGVY